MITDNALMTRRGALSLCAGAALMGCASRTNPPNPELAPVVFGGAPIPLAVQQVSVLVPPRKTADPRPVDADFVVTIEQMARQWPKQRLSAIGGGYTARYVVDEATAVSRLTERGGEVVFAVAQVRLILRTPYGVEEAGAGARVESELRIEGQPNMIERQEALHGLMLETADKLNTQLSASINRQLARYIKR